MKSGIAYLKYFSFQVEWKVFLITFSSINMNFSLPKLFDDDPTLFKKRLDQHKILLRLQNTSYMMYTYVNIEKGITTYEGSNGTKIDRN